MRVVIVQKWGMIIQRLEAKKIINTINNVFHVCYIFFLKSFIHSSSSSALSAIFPWNWARSCKFQDFRRRLFIHNWLIELSGLFKWIFPATTAETIFRDHSLSLFLCIHEFFNFFVRCVKEEYVKICKRKRCVFFSVN